MANIEEEPIRLVNPAFCQKASSTDCWKDRASRALPDSDIVCSQFGSPTLGGRICGDRSGRSCDLALLLLFSPVSSF